MLWQHFFVFSLNFMRIYYPLILKTYVRIQPPIQWKGGMLQELFKGKGSSSVCSNFRDVMLACVDGENVAKYVRNKFLPRAKVISLNTQFGGGFNGGETAFAHLYARLVNQACRNSRRTCANLFLDVISAFASLLRCIVFDVEAGDEAWFFK